MTIQENDNEEKNNFVKALKLANEQTLKDWNEHCWKIMSCDHKEGFFYYDHWHTFQDKPTWKERLAHCHLCDGDFDAKYADAVEKVKL